MSTTFLTKEQALGAKKWYLFDAKGKTLGRLATEIAKVLRGKHKPNYTPHVDSGDGVIVINAEEVQVTGAKEAQKIYRSYSGFVGSGRETSYRSMMQTKPEYIIFHAVKGMMPNKSKLGRSQLKKLRIFKKDKHDMQAQRPIVVNI